MDLLYLWKHSPDPDPEIDQIYWLLFQSTMSSCGVSWTFSNRFNKALFLDMNIWTKKGRLLISLFTKPLNRHLFIPPNSCHSPGVFKRLVLGHIQRMFMFYSLKKDIQIKLDLLFERLLNRSYVPSLVFGTLLQQGHPQCYQLPHQILQILHTYERNVLRIDVIKIIDFFSSTSFSILITPTPSKTKQAWKKIVANPAGNLELSQLTTEEGYHFPAGRFIWCVITKLLTLAISFHTYISLKEWGPQYQPVWFRY